MGVADESTKRMSDIEPAEWKGKMQRKPEDMVQYIVEKGLTEVPAEFILPLHMRPAQEQRSLGGIEVPVIDMALLNDEEGKKQVQAQITRACEEWGFFQIINHGVPATLMDAEMDMARRFYALTSEEKEVFKMRTATGGQGYGRIHDKKPGDIREWSDRLVLNLPSAKDIYNSHDLVVDNPPGFQEVYNEYGEAVYGVAKKLMAIISEELGQPADFLFNKIGKEKTNLKTLVNYYPQCPQPELALGIQPHGDGSVLTILQQDEIRGLQVLKDGSWIPVQKSSDHALIVNIGDVLQLISNDRFKSALHRAVAQKTSRISIACFVIPHRETLLQPAAELCNEMNPPLYRGLSIHEYLVEFLKMGFNTNARVLEFFKLVPADTAM